MLFSLSRTFPLDHFFFLAFPPPPPIASFFFAGVFDALGSAFFDVFGGILLQMVVLPCRGVRDSLGRRLGREVIFPLRRGTVLRCEKDISNSKVGPLGYY